MLLLLCVLEAIALGRPKSNLTLDGPTEARGDGRTPVIVRVALGDLAPTEAAGIAVETNAGRVVSQRLLHPQFLDVELIPPRVVEPFLLVITAKLPRGLGQGSTSIRLLPAIEPPAMRSSNGPLDLRAPRRLVLERDAQGEISYRQRSRSPVTLHVSAGTISAVERSDGDVYRAEYRPPEDRLPRVVLVVAVSDDGSLLDWVPIQLVGLPQLKTVSEPGASVLARVGDEDFGPFRADRRGRVEMRVLAPPGVASAQTFVRDAVGNEQSLKLNLGVPNAQTTFSVCPPASESFHFFAVDATGAPRRNLDIHAQSSLGTVTRPQVTPRGHYSSLIALPVSATLGETFTIQAAIVGETNTRLHCKTSVVGEAPTRIRLTASPNPWVAGSRNSVLVQADVSYVGARKPRMVPLVATTDFGTLDHFEAQSLERYQALWHLPVRLGERRLAKLTVQTSSANSVQDQIVITLRPGSATELRLTLEQAQLKADGHSETHIIARAFDAFGNLTDATPRVERAIGSITPFVRHSIGSYSANYQAPQSATLTADDITVRVESSSAVRSVRVQLIPTSSRFRVWGGAGYSSNFGKVTAPLAILGANVRLPLLGERLAFGIDVSFLSSRRSEPDATQAESVTLQLRLLPIVGRVTYELATARIKPYFGIGAGIAPVQFDYTSYSADTYRRWRAPAVFAAMFGGMYRFGPGSAWCELAYRHIAVSDSTVSGNVGGLMAAMGYAYAF